MPGRKNSRVLDYSFAVEHLLGNTIMPSQSPLRLIKRWKRYEPREKCGEIPPMTRGVYVLYKRDGEDYNVTYIGIAGLGRRSGAAGRLKSHNARKEGWTHFSLFEVHDNITCDEIRELEALLLGIFRHDPRIELTNKQKGSSKLYQLRHLALWRE